MRRDQRFLGAVERVASIAELPAGRINALPGVREVLDAADDLARLSELDSHLDAVKVTMEASPAAARLAFAAVFSRADDRLVLGHGDEDLTLLRIDFQGTEAEVPELDAALRSTADGSFSPRARGRANGSP